MSKQKKNYMTQLDAWSNEIVVAPLLDNGVEAIERVQKAIREKVLESYRNGMKAQKAISNLPQSERELVEALAPRSRNLVIKRQSFKGGRYYQPRK
jgi:hypothetical protein